MTTALAQKTIRIPSTPTQRFINKVERAKEIWLAHRARADADYAQRIREAYEEELATEQPTNGQHTDAPAAEATAEAPLPS